MFNFLFKTLKISLFFSNKSRIFVRKISLCIHTEKRLKIAKYVAFHLRPALATLKVDARNIAVLSADTKGIAQMPCRAFGKGLKKAFPKTIAGNGKAEWDLAVTANLEIILAKPERTDFPILFTMGQFRTAFMSCTLATFALVRI